MKEAQACFMKSVPGAEDYRDGATVSEGEAAWFGSAEHLRLTQRHQSEDAEAGVSGMTLGEVDELFARGPDAAVQFLPSRANLVCWPFGAGGGEDLAGGAGQRVGGDVGVTGDDYGD